MAFYSAYFDESTGNDSPILVVAGFLSNDAFWGGFEREWHEVLSGFNLSSFMRSILLYVRANSGAWKKRPAKPCWGGFWILSVGVPSLVLPAWFMCGNSRKYLQALCARRLVRLTTCVA